MRTVKRISADWDTADDQPGTQHCSLGLKRMFHFNLEKNEFWLRKVPSLRNALQHGLELH